MNTKLVTFAIALIASTSAFADQCPGRASSCPSYKVVASQPANYQGTPVADVQGRAALVVSKLNASKPKEAVVSYEKLYKAGRA